MAQFPSHRKEGEIEMLYVYPFSEATLPGTCDAELRVPTLSDVLQFGSGSRFPNFSGKLKFDHDNTLTAKRYASTGDDNEFAFNLMEDIFEAYGFGLP